MCCSISADTTASQGLHQLLRTTLSPEEVAAIESHFRQVRCDTDYKLMECYRVTYVGPTGS